MALPESPIEVLVVGSGGGGLVAALTAAAAGRVVLVVDYLPTIGGSTAISVFFFKQKTAYEMELRLEFRRVLFRSSSLRNSSPTATRTRMPTPSARASATA